MQEKNRIGKLIDAKKQQIYDCSDRIWEFAETRFDVGKSADVLCELLEQEGFTIERGVAHMDHAFVASYGNGSPVIGILAEYDALGNLSQVAGLPEKKYLVEKGNGHGCAHHALGAGAVAGAIGVKDFMEESGLSGTIKLFGCPAEESGYGKAFMARDGVFNGLDAALTWHPGDATWGFTGQSLAVFQLYFNFKGRAAHAAGMPEHGRSALDAAELMNIGVNFLREHMIDQARIHYAFMDAGGESANVVQPTASLYYFIRAPKTRQVQEIYERVVKIAQGAALMTETELEMVWDSAAANYIPNNTLTKAMYENLKPFMPLDLTEEETAYQKMFCDTLDDSMKNGVKERARTVFGSLGEEKVREIAESPVLRELMPYVEPDGGVPMGGSTDVGDVSWNVPTAQVMIASLPQGAPAHSWQWVATGKSSVMHKGVLLAGKTIAMTAYDLLTRPELLKAAKEEHEKNLEGETYQSAIPADVLPR